MPAQEMHNVRFAIFFIAAVLGAVLLLISQIPLTKEGYDVVETRSFSVGERLTFDWTFEPNVRYRFEMKGVYWTNQSSYFHSFTVGSFAYEYGPEGAFVENPWSGGYVETQTLNVTFWQYGSHQIDQAPRATVVEVSALRETTYHLTYLLYVGLPMLIIGAILITITGKDVDSRTRMPDTSARRIPSLSFSNTQVRRAICVSFFQRKMLSAVGSSAQAGSF